MTEAERAFLNWRLTTADIVYRMPDHPSLLQSFIWQDYDRAPKFPALNEYLRWWDRTLEGKLHSVRVAVSGLFLATDLRQVGNEFWLN